MSLTFFIIGLLAVLYFVSGDGVYLLGIVSITIAGAVFLPTARLLWGHLAPR